MMRSKDISDGSIMSLDRWFVLIHRRSVKSDFTTQPVAASWGVDPEFIEVPRMKPLFGIGRSLTYALIERGDIKSKVLRRKGCIKGKRLIDVQSVREFIAKQPEDVDPRLSAKCKEANRVMREKRPGALGVVQMRSLRRASNREN
jgi:hypothetical protein